MKRYYTHYWTNNTWEYNKKYYGEETLIHIAGNLFKKRGVSKGDIIYVVTVIKGKLYICGKLVVGKICSVTEAARILNCTPENLWEASEHIIASEATKIDFNLRIPLELTQKLKFKSHANSKPLLFKSYDYLDQQTLRGVRELDPISIIEIDELFFSLEKQIYPDEINEDTINTASHWEGAIKQVKVNQYERNAKARKECIKFYGVSCAICNFNFEKFYGDIGEGLIHIHHLKPLSEIGKKYKIDPIKDLRPVCPNCHTVIHSKKLTMYTIEELKEILKQRRNN